MVHTQHCLFLSIMVGSAATQTSQYIMLGSNFLMAMYDTLHIIVTHKKGKTSRENLGWLKKLKVLILDIFSIMFIMF